MLLQIAALLLTGASFQEAPAQVVLFSATTIPDETRRIWGEWRGQVSGPALTKPWPKLDNVAKGLQVAGYEVRLEGSLIVGISRELETFRRAQESEEIVKSLKECEKSGVFSIDSNAPGAGGTIDKLVRSTYLNAAPGTYSATIMPTISIRMPGASQAQVAQIHFQPSAEVETKLREHCLTLSKDAGQKKLVQARPRQSGYHTNWSPSVGDASTLARANDAFAKALSEQEAKIAAAKLAAKEFLQKAYQDKLGSNFPEAKSKYNDLSPWLKEQLTTKVRENYASYGFDSADSALRELGKSQVLDVSVNFSVSFCFRDTDGTIGMATFTGFQG